MPKDNNGLIRIMPGLTTMPSAYEADGRWTGGDKVRFIGGQPEKIGGWEQWNNAGGELPHICRSALAWFDFNYNSWKAFGTTHRLWVYDQNKDRTNITPFVSTGTLANPFTTTNGQTAVTVDDNAHGLVVGQSVYFSGAAAVGGITINGEYQVTSVINPNKYTITHSSPATATAGPGGGAAVAYSYELAAGNVDTYSGGGWGLGTYGTGTWGTVRGSNTYLQFPRFWSLDKYGQYLVAQVSGGGLYMWQLNIANRAAVVPNSPPFGLFSFITSERIMVVLGAYGDFMRVDWNDDDDYTDWTPSVLNTANIRRLQEGSRLIAGARMTRQINVIWSDTALYVMQWTGGDEVYATSVVGRDCGLVGPAAFAVVDGQPYWMSAKGFMTYAGSVAEIPRAADVQSIFNDLSNMQRVKTSCFYNAEFNEVWWQYPSLNAAEPEKYVAVNLEDFSWTFGSMDRTCWMNANVTGLPEVYGVDSAGVIYQHETGTDADGAAMAWSITSGFFDIGDGNTGMNITGYIPDFKRQSGAIVIEFTSKDYPQDAAVLDTVTKTIAANQAIVDLRHHGRQSRLTLSQNMLGGDFRLGAHRLELAPSGARR